MVTIYSLEILPFPIWKESIVPCRFNYCFLTHIKISQVVGQVVWHSSICQNYAQFIMIHIHILFTPTFTSTFYSNPKRWCCESAALNMSAYLENSAVVTGLKKVSFHSNSKERKCQRMQKVQHNCTHLTHQQSNTQNSPSQALAIHELWTSRCSTWF